MSNRALRTLLATASPILLGSGGAAWAVITKQLKDQDITVPEDADRLAGKPVAGPITAYMQAETVAKHAHHMGGGRTFADVSAEFMKASAGGDTERAEELSGPRDLLMQANFTRASLFTSVLAYGVSALVIGMGALTGLAAATIDTDN